MTRGNEIKEFHTGVLIASAAQQISYFTENLNGIIQTIILERNNFNIGGGTALNFLQSGGAIQFLSLDGTDFTTAPKVFKPFAYGNVNTDGETGSPWASVGQPVNGPIHISGTSLGALGSITNIIIRYR